MPTPNKKDYQERCDNAVDYLHQSHDSEMDELLTGYTGGQVRNLLLNMLRHYVDGLHREPTGENPAEAMRIVQLFLNIDEYNRLIDDIRYDGLDETKLPELVRYKLDNPPDGKLSYE